MCVINQSNQQQYLDIYYIPVYSTNNTQVLPVNQSDHIFMKHQPTTSINLLGDLFQSYYVPTRYQSITSFSLPKRKSSPIRLHTYQISINHILLLTEDLHQSDYIPTRYQSITSFSLPKIFTNPITYRTYQISINHIYQLFEDHKPDHMLTKHQSITSICLLKITNHITCLLDINQSHPSAY